MIVDLVKIREYVDKKLVSEQKHPTGDLYIFNYTHKCQADGTWDDVTKMCRGLITDGSGKVVARPFDKFFNQSENGEPHQGLFKAYDKMDGSLGIMYPLDGKLYIATRGSFTSDQAIEGTKMLAQYMDSKDVRDIMLQEAKKRTYLFEIIYPENRIVVDYGKERKITLLATRNIETGEVHTEPQHEIFESTKEVGDFATPRDNAEGVVLYYTDGFMEKVKYEEYVRLHRLITGVTARRIWDLLRNDQLDEFREMTTRVPEEFRDWVLNAAQILISSYQRIEDASHEAYLDVKKLKTRKGQALKLNKKHKAVAPIVFAMLSGKPYSQIIWKILKPAAERPFREDM